MRIPPTMSRSRAGLTEPARVRIRATARARRSLCGCDRSRVSVRVSGVVVVMWCVTLRASGGGAEIGGGHLVGDVLGLAHGGDATVDHDGGVVGDGQGGTGELLDDEQGPALLGQLVH